MRFFPDSRNDEPFLFLLSTMKKAWRTVTYSAKVGLNLACLLLQYSFYIRVESADAYGACFSEVGGYMHDSHYPILPKGVCAGFLVHNYANLWRRIGLQRPTSEPDCCHFDIIINSSTVPCMSRTYIQQLSDEKKGLYIIQKWDMSEHISEVVVWHGPCTMDIYKSDGHSYIATCIDIDWYTRERCDVMLHYYASLRTSDQGVLKLSTESEPRQICHQKSCYYIPNGVTRMSWADAEARCHDMNSTLVSVSSDAEWTFLTQNNFFRATTIQLFYIGYKKLVSVIFGFLLVI